MYSVNLFVWSASHVTPFHLLVSCLQIRTAPEAFGTTTIAARHGVGSVTLEIAPKSSVCLNSA